MDKIPVIIILGPTAIGKSRLGLELADKIKGEIISADSMQVYRQMDIGTSKPSKEELRKIPHHLINIKNPDQEWNLAMFLKEANRLPEDIYSRNKIPIVVGGTGLYLWSLIEGFIVPPGEPDYAFRNEMEKESSSVLHDKLSEIDPAAASKIHPHDRKRIIRFLETCLKSGQPASLKQKRKKPEKYSFKIIGINDRRENVYRLIDCRADKMIKDGLIEEVKMLLDKGYSKKLPSFQALGYKEAADYLSGEINKEEMIETLKKRTRNFARRQLTWFRRFAGVHWLKVDASAEDAFRLLSNFI
jgi:tRNA dimethylallyltransferase